MHVAKEGNVNCEYWEPSSQYHFQEHCSSKWYPWKKIELCTLRRREPDGPLRDLLDANSNSEEAKLWIPSVFSAEKECFNLLKASGNFTYDQV
jgi:hypothetical protein